MKTFSVRDTGFTLIELLIVVAIIAILAAIAVPNFLEAQVRSKYSRVKSDMRTLATSLEQYKIDSNAYPEYAVIQFPGTTVDDPATAYGMDYFECFSRRIGTSLTTPIAYMNSIPSDTFAVGKFPGPQPYTDDFSYKNSRQNFRIFGGDVSSEPWLGVGGSKLLQDWGEWRLSSGGPDGTRIADIKKNIVYDPTNGTVSAGDIVRCQIRPESVPKP